MVLELSKLIQSEGESGKFLTWEFFSDLRDEGTLHSLFETDMDISLEGIDFFGHDGLIWLAIILLCRTPRGHRTKVYLPNDSRTVEIIRLLGFHFLRDALQFELLPAFRVDMQEPKRYPPKDKGIAKLHKIQLVRAGAIPQITIPSSRLIRDYLTNEFGIDPTQHEAKEMLDPYTDTLAELVENIGKHGGSQTGNGMGFVTFAPGPKNRRVLRYCFSDIGRGFKDTISPKLDLKPETEVDAIAEGFLYRCWNKQAGIEGLYPTLDFICSKSGTIGIRSRDVLFKLDLSSKWVQSRFRAGYSKPTPTWIKSMAKVYGRPMIRGTHIYVDLQLPPLP